MPQGPESSVLDVEDAGEVTLVRVTCRRLWNDEEARALGRQLSDVLAQDRIDHLVDRTRNGGAEVVALLKTGSAYYAPSAAAARMARAVMEDSGAVMPVCAWVDGEYGISGVYLGVEAELGATGIRRVVARDLTEPELAALREAAEAEIGRAHV